ncbi:phosphoribosylamine-glycine ligase [Thermoplasma volcanium GSS1]|uniref:phosphoribosylamine--glycine ligase n=1 Tax=Thermoplasma volcanium (strain ATCC 51530 / DSM 4299 / JCM 9571 / NBRC 15438 / GSS1) TaxID=273116 RepID=Q97B35_THEVO|nr:phosphoribosylamine--glycine ligase [Thermoplasma volcanium]BAB59766.1 phosphoribosylamine-glycine ligase [Thermoplasma volcanium GSS1]
MVSRVLLIGSGGREDAIARAIKRSGAKLFSVIGHENPSIKRLSEKYLIGDEKDYKSIEDFALSSSVDIVFVGPDPVLETPLVNNLLKRGIAVASPTMEAAQIETSKMFMRDLLTRHSIPGNINYKKCFSEQEVKDFFDKNKKDVAVKPIGLTGGKGVKVMGEQLKSQGEAINYAIEVLQRDGVVLIEDRMIGEEFSLQAFTDGKNTSFMPIVQDYKRAFEGDTGPNTGGMGSISDVNFSLPFLSKKAPEDARHIINDVVRAMYDENIPFKGVMYGQFMDTPDGVKVIEINARFADPEGINVLSLLKSDFVETLYQIYSGELNGERLFEDRATVLKYIVPPGYGQAPLPGDLHIDPEIEKLDTELYYAAVSGTLYDVKMSSSRSLAILGKADNIPEASEMVDSALKYVHGSYYVRRDIGKKEFLEKKIMAASRAKS